MKEYIDFGQLRTDSYFKQGSQLIPYRHSSLEYCYKVRPKELIRFYLFYWLYLVSLLSIPILGFAVSAENGEASHQDNEMFAEPETVNNIQEDLFNDIYDKATEVSLISFKHCSFIIM